MPSIGDITGRIVIQDAGSPVAIKFGENIDAVGKTIIASMSRATLATETAARQIAANLDKIKTQMKPTDSAKGLVADLDSLNTKLREEIAAVKGGPAAIDALNKKRLEQANALRVAAAQAQAGVSAESALGKSIAAQFAVHDKLQRELQQTASERARAIALAEREAERYSRLTQAVTGLAVAFVAFTARGAIQFLKDAGKEAIEAEKAIAQLRAGVESTGGAAGKSVEELSALADELSRLSGFDDELIAGGEAILLTFRRVRGEAFDQTIRLALDLSARFGKDIDSSVIMIAKALDTLMSGSARGLAALSKAGVTFTDSQKKMMEQLVRTGRAAEAEKMFFAELEAQFGGSARAARETMGGALQALGVAWSNLKEEIGGGGIVMTGAIDRLIALVETMTDGFKLLHLGAALAFKGILNLLAQVDIFVRRVQLSIVELQAKLVKLSPFSSDQQKLDAEIAVSKTRFNLEQVRTRLAERNRQIDADIAKQTMALLGILPKVQANYGDIGDEIGRVKSKQQDWFDDLHAELARQTQALGLLRQGMPVEEIENLVEAAQGLGKTNLLDPLVVKAGLIKNKIDAIAAAFKLADEAKKKFSEAGDDLDELIRKQFENVGGGNDPQMQAFLARLQEARALTDSLKTDEQRRAETIAKAVQLYEEFNGKVLTHEQLQKILLANADQWNVELDETQLKFNEIYERLSYIAEGIAFDLVSNWRRAWEENESIVDATVDTLRNSFLNVLEDIISQWLAAWFKAMAAWLARWIATQRAAQISSAQTAAVAGASGATGGVGSLLGMGAVAGGGAGAGAGSAAGAGGMSSNVAAYGGWALAAFGLYVVYKGFVERERKKFAQITIEGGKWEVTASRGRKYLDGVSAAAESIVTGLTKFLSDIDVTMTRLGTVIIESSKSGWNVSIPGSTGKLFASMEEAVSYAQVLMAKYGQFADSVSTLVKGVITATKAISIEQLAGDIDWARMLETQNLEQAALDVSRAMDVAIANWKRAEELFLSFYSINLPAFEAAIDSIITKLGSDLIGIYNRLAGIEEDPEKAWQRQKAAYNAQRLLVLAQLKLWELEIAARVANYNAQRKILGGGPGGGKEGGGAGDGMGGGGLIGIAAKSLMVAGILADAAGIIDPALQALLDIQALINQAINEIPPELTDADFPGRKGKGGGGKRQRQEMRQDLRDEIANLEAEARGPLHAALFDLGQNLAAFRERAKEAKLSAAEVAHGVELMTEVFQRSVQEQARGYAGLETDLTRRLREITAFFAELRELGESNTGLSLSEVGELETRALDLVGREIHTLIDGFAGLADPMQAIYVRAGELQQGLLAYAEAVGLTSDQINAAMDRINEGINLQRQQGINSTLDKLFGYLKQAGLYQQEAIEFERQKALTDIALIEAQLSFYAALDSKTAEMIDKLRGFVNSEAFGRNDQQDIGGDNEVVAVRVVEGDWTTWDDIVETIKSLVEEWRAGVKQFAESTANLLTDEALTNLTQEEQLAFARAQVQDLATRAQAGDIEALGQLSEARAEFLRELRESEAAGFGFDKGFDWVMDLTAQVLRNAKAAEDQMIAQELAKNVQAWSYVMGKLAEQLETAFYANTQDLIDAIYDAVGGVPSLASGGIVMSGPRLVRVSEYVPEAIVPLDKLSQMIPYSLPANLRSGMGGFGTQQQSRPGPLPYDFAQRSSLSKWGSIEQTNRVSASALRSIRDDLNAMRRRGEGR